MLQSTRETAVDGTVTLRFHGEMTIETAGEVREALLGALQDQQTVRLNCEEVTGIDFFGLQLLCSAHRTSVARKTLLVWDGARVPIIEEVVRNNGFSRHCGCSLCPQDIACMWI